ncbi:23S rRNA (adenine(2030)-N(6))-methyltransferase RlmJ [Pusillimonas sp. NJUB218]|uniref:23S rRNA (adenine(2030)-N(6))-methyltransferase RlmJ n=1 Tax=Pusillimonas sp. NJUB218 TaxID=2023230 RepID=UPI000F4D0A6E|nr:23S rRNA (adenine(2030)-N(6))-methyltransferase RlmJ [Pusillimonas sp. NJUB218]ROT45195.1 23S rRNA (adenine(2030)-N(6))-methyltransferase RlmJ [Pusillimonas sp. NJUB218]
MFSYRHAFHAGNHADVLKHSILVQILDYFNQKDTPYWVIDTHAGAGIYDLTDEWATKNAEFTDGLDRVLATEKRPPMIERYLEAVGDFNPDGVANYYPGSPWLAMQALRQKDRLRLFELHPNEIAILQENLAQQDRSVQKKVMVYEQDGFTGLRALLPPPTRRSVTIIDPSYEAKSDYRATLQCVQDALRRFPTGCYAVWYPLVQRREVTELQRSLEKLKDCSWVNATLSVRKPPSDGFGLFGSGMFIINPPYTLHDALARALPWLSKTLALDNRATFTLKKSGASKDKPKDKGD